MIFIIFTPEGLTELHAQMTNNNAVIWINPSLLNSDTLTQLRDTGIQIQLLPDEVNANKEKPVIAALAHVEQHSPKGSDIFVEYP